MSDWFEQRVQELEAEIASSKGTAKVDALNSLAYTLTRRRAADRVISIAERAMDLADSLGYSAGEATARVHYAAALTMKLKFDEAGSALDKALAYLETAGDSQSLISAYNCYGIINFGLARYAQAHEWYSRAETVAERMDLPDAKSIAYQNLAIVFKKIGDIRRSLLYNAKLHELHKATGDINGLALSFSRLGSVYYAIGNFEKAIEYYFEALATYSASDRKLGHDVFEVTMNIGGLYGELKNYTTGLEYLFRALAMVSEETHPHGFGHCLTHIGGMFADLSDETTAFQYYLRSIKIYENAGDPIGIAMNLKHLGALHQKVGNLEKAEELFHKSLDSFKAAHHAEGIVDAMTALANIMFIRKEYARSADTFLEALTLSNSMGSIKTAAAIHEGLAEVYSAIGEKGKSAHHAKDAKKLRTSMYGNDFHKSIAKIVQHYQTELTRRETEFSSSLGNSLTADADEIFSFRKRSIEKLAPDTAAAAQKVVEVTTFGRFSVTVDGRELTAEDWRRKKARDVFKYLLLRHQQAVTFDELTDALWPDSAGKDVQNSVWNAISYIRLALEPELKPKMPSSFISFSDGSYTLDVGEKAVVDFLEFKAAIHASFAAKDDSVKLSHLEKAVELYTGEFLKEDVFEEWTDYERQTLKDNYLNALNELSELHLDSGNYAAASRYAKKILESDPTYEEAYRIMLELFEQTGHNAGARSLMEQCRKAFMKETGGAPPKWLQQLAVSVAGN